MTHPIDLPDDPKPSVGEAYRVYPVRPARGWRVALVLLVAAFLIGAVLTVGLS